MWDWKNLVALLASFAGAFGVGVMVWFEPERQPPRQPAGTPELAEATRAEPQATAPLNQSDLSPKGPPIQDAPEVAGSRELQAALRGIALPAVPGGDGVITGRVTDENGAPVAGTAINLRPYVSRYSRHVDPGDTTELLADTWSQLEEDVRELARARLRTHSPERLKVTGADGAFAFTGLPDGKYSIAHDHADYRLLVRSPGEPFEPGAHIEIAALSAIKLTVQIDLPAGADPAMCTAKVIGEPMLGQLSGKPVQPGTWRYVAGPGTYVVSAAYSGNPARSAPQLVTLTTADPARTVIVKFEWTPTIEVEGEWSEGSPTGREELRLVPNSPGLTVNLALFEQGRKLTDYNRFGRERLYQAGATEPGSYLLGAILGRNLLRWVRVEHTSAFTRVKLALTTPGAGTSITIMCKDETGAPSWANAVDRMVGEQVVHDAFDVWSLPNGELRAVLRESYQQLTRREPAPTLHVSRYDGQFRKVHLTHWGPQRVEVTFARRARIYVRLSGDTRGAHSLRYGITPESGSPYHRLNEMLEYPGIVMLSNMPPGKVRIHVEYVSQLGNFTLATAECHVEAGGVIVDVHLPLQGAVTLVTKEPVEGLVLAGSSSDAPFELQPVSFKVEWRTPFLPVGIYTATWKTAAGGVAHTKTFRVDGDAKITLD